MSGPNRIFMALAIARQLVNELEQPDVEGSTVTELIEELNEVWNDK